MRFIRLILVSIIMLCIAVLFVFALFPADVRISRVVSVHAPAEKIHSAINDFNAWSRWNEFVNQPNSAKNISTPASGVGAFVESNGMRITILSSTLDSIKTSWTQSNRKPFTGGFNIISSDDHFVVEWYFNFHFKWYPWEKLGSMFYDKQLGPVMEKSLLNLRTYTENP